MKQASLGTACVLAVAACVSVLAAADSSADAATPEKVVLNNSVGQLSIAPSGAMRFTTESQACPVWSVRSGEMWKITLAKGDDPFKLSDAIDFTPGSENVPKFATTEDGVEFRYDTLRHGQETWDIGLTLQVRQVDDEFQFSAKTDNRADGRCVQHLKFPILFDIRKDGADHREIATLLPSFLGERLATPDKFGKHRRMTYPSGRAAAMQYCVFDSGKAGLYLACHDSKRSRKNFAIANRDSSYDFSLENEPYCMSGQSWSSAPAVVMPYAGTWHTAARRYRAWIDTWMKWAPMPQWVRNENAGWFLCILKQQNGDLMFRYDELDRVADIADQWGLDVLGLFGWAHGGHDRDYPDYHPDPKMGGPEVLKAAIKRVQKRGKKVMLYANGQLLDTASKFYKEHGAECTSLQPDGKPYSDRYNKFKSTPDPTFARACFGSEVWYQRLYELGVQAQDLGADGFIYDQFGIGGPGFCYNQSHGHGKPNEAWAECRFQLTKRLTEALRARKPDFVVMTEWVIDGLMEDFPYFHGCGNGFYPFVPTPQQKNFPELFLYTFPELVATQRNPNPMSTRNSTNHACLYGIRHETESRYVADVKYLGGTLPVPEDYADCNSPPKVREVCSTPLEPAAKYMRDVIAMRDRFGDFFKRGRFIDIEGFCFRGTDSVARGFLANDGRLGVVVWNHSEKPQNVTISAAGRKLLGVFAPGETTPVEESQPVPPETVRFFLWSAKESYVPAGYEPVWGDEFDRSSLDAGNWTLRKDMGGNADLSLAGEERPDVVCVSDGELRLNAVRNTDRSNGALPYTTCYSVTTFDKMHFQYGYLEMRAKVPYGQGAWPSFWMKALPGTISPPRFKDYMVEVDVFEVFSSPDTAVPNLHKWYSGGKKHTQSGCPNRYTFADASNLRDEYHIYGFEWTPREMAMFIDGEEYCVYDLSVDFDKGGSMQGFHDPLYVIFNNHIFTEHSPWKPKGSKVDERSRFPMQYWIDWIRLYQKPGVGALYTAKKEGK